MSGSKERERRRREERKVEIEGWKDAGRDEE